MSLIEKYTKNEITLKKLNLLKNLIEGIKILIPKIIDKRYLFVDISFKHLSGLSYAFSIEDKLSKDILVDVLFIKIRFKNTLSLNEEKNEIIDFILTDAKSNKILKIKEFKIYIDKARINQKVKNTIAFFVKEEIDKLAKKQKN